MFCGESSDGVLGRAELFCGEVLAMQGLYGRTYRGTSLIRVGPCLGPYSGPKGGAVSYERVTLYMVALLVSIRQKRTAFLSGSSTPAELPRS